MKTSFIFNSLALVCATFLFTSCSAYQKAQWAAGMDTIANETIMDCQHEYSLYSNDMNAPNYSGPISVRIPFPMGSGHNPVCHKCNGFKQIEYRRNAEGMVDLMAGH